MRFTTNWRVIKMKQLLLLTAFVLLVFGQQYAGNGVIKPPTTGSSGLDLVPADIRSRAVRVTPEVLNSLSVIAPGLRNSVPTSPGPSDQKYGGPSSFSVRPSDPSISVSS
jgi:hypothetical protein